VRSAARARSRSFRPQRGWRHGHTDTLTTGTGGVATVTCGPGLTQVGTADGRRAQPSPLVLVIGDPAGIEEHSPEQDQRRLSRPAARAITTSIDNVADEVAGVLRRAHRCPVVLNLPIDLQTILRPDFSTSPGPHAASVGRRRSLAPLFAKLLAAERPVIVAGGGARAAGAKEEIVKLADRIGALLATSLNGKGLFAGEEYDVGISGTFATAPAEHLMVEADFVLAIGAQLNYYTAEGGLMFPSAEVARVDIDPAPEEMGFLPGLRSRRCEADRGSAQQNARCPADQRRVSGHRRHARCCNRHACLRCRRLDRGCSRPTQNA
jgi:thiamine pyrophosphate-dependent acetolactate synthase large subunit-like protein